MCWATPGIALSGPTSVRPCRTSSPDRSLPGLLRRGSPTTCNGQSATRGNRSGCAASSIFWGLAGILPVPARQGRRCRGSSSLRHARGGEGRALRSGAFLQGRRCTGPGVHSIRGPAPVPRRRRASHPRHDPQNFLGGRSGTRCATPPFLGRVAFARSPTSSTTTALG